MNDSNTAGYTNFIVCPKCGWGYVQGSTHICEQDMYNKYNYVFSTEDKDMKEIKEALVRIEKLLEDLLKRI